MLPPNCKLIENRLPLVNQYFCCKSGTFFVTRYKNFSCLYKKGEDRVFLDLLYEHPTGRMQLTSQEIVKYLILKSKCIFGTMSCCYELHRSGLNNFFVFGEIPIEEKTILISSDSQEKYYLKRRSDQDFSLNAIFKDHTIMFSADCFNVENNILKISWCDTTFVVTEEKYEN